MNCHTEKEKKKVYNEKSLTHDLVIPSLAP